MGSLSTYPQDARDKVPMNRTRRDGREEIFLSKTPGLVIFSVLFFFFLPRVEKQS